MALRLSFHFHFVITNDIMPVLENVLCFTVIPMLKRILAGQTKVEVWRNVCHNATDQHFARTMYSASSSSIKHSIFKTKLLGKARD